MDDAYVLGLDDAAKRLETVSGPVAMGKEEAAWRLYERSLCIDAIRAMIAETDAGEKGER